MRIAGDLAMAPFARAVSFLCNVPTATFEAAVVHHTRLSGVRPTTRTTRANLPESKNPAGALAADETEDYRGGCCLCR